MEEENKHIEFVEEKESQTSGGGSLMRGLVDGSLLTRKAVVKQLPFVLFLVFLGLIYISNRYHAEMLRKRIDGLRIETSELRSKAIFVSSELMKLSRQTEVADEVTKNGLDLKESMEPPKTIIVKKKTE